MASRKAGCQPVTVRFNLPVKFKLSSNTATPVYVVDDKIIPAGKVNFVTGNYQNIATIRYINAKQAIEKFGESAKSGAIIITTIPVVDQKNLKPSLDLKDFKVYPVPNSGQFQVEFKAEELPVELSILDVKGTVILQKSIKNFNGHFAEEITIEKVPAGVVMIQIQQDQKWFTYPVIIN